MNWIILVGFLIANIVYLECRKIRKLKQGKEHCLPVSNGTETRKLKCKDGLLLSDINITSYVWQESKCQDTRGCSGLQLEVLMSLNLCYWKNSCNLEYSRTTPIIKTSNRTCIGQFPAQLYVTYQCARNESITFFQNDLEVDSGQKDVTSDMGLIVSHFDFPWHYMKELSFHLTLRPSSSKLTHLHLWRRHFELDERDWLRVKTGNQNWRNFSDVHGAVEGQPVEFEFKTFIDSYRAPGFVLCYRWSEQRQLASKDEICGKQRGRKKPNSRIGKRRRGGKGKGGNKKGRREKNKNKSQRKNRKNKKKKGRKGVRT